MGKCNKTIDMCINGPTLKVNEYPAKLFQPFFKAYANHTENMNENKGSSRTTVVYVACLGMRSETRFKQKSFQP